MGTDPGFMAQLKNGIIIGTREKIDELLQKYQPSGKKEDVPEYLNSNVKEIDMERELKRVAKAFNVEVGELRHRRRNFPPRLAAYYHLVEHCGVPIRQTASLFQISGPAVSSGLRAFQKLAQHDKTLREKSARLKNGVNF